MPVRQKQPPPIRLHRVTRVAAVALSPLWAAGGSSPCPRKTAGVSILPPGRVEELNRHNEAVEKKPRAPDCSPLVDPSGSNGSVKRPSAGINMGLLSLNFGHSAPQTCVRKADVRSATCHCPSTEKPATLAFFWSSSCVLSSGIVRRFQAVDDVLEIAEQTEV